MRISKSAMAVGGVVLAVAMIGFTNPKTVHAVAAALVQVTNTASNPVVNSDVTTTSSQLIAIDCTQQFQLGCRRIAPGGLLDTTEYVVPSGQILVITDVVIQTSGSGGFIQVDIQSARLVTGVFTSPIFETVTNDISTHHIAFIHGAAFAGGSRLLIDGAGVIPPVTLQGYLTPAN